MFVSMVYLVLFGRRHLCRGPFRARTSRLILASSLFFIFLFLSLSLYPSRSHTIWLSVFLTHSPKPQV